MSELEFLASSARIPIANIAAVDISQRSIETIRLAGVDGVRLDVSSADLPYSSGSFSCVIMSEVIEHLLDPDHALIECRRVLSPSGTLILTTPNLAAWFNRIALLIGFQPIYTETGMELVHGRGPLVKASRPVGHVHLFTLHALKPLLRSNGLQVVQVLGLAYEGKEKNNPILGGVDRVFSGIPELAAGLLVTCVVA